MSRPLRPHLIPLALLISIGIGMLGFVAFMVTVIIQGLFA